MCSLRAIAVVRAKQGRLHSSLRVKRIPNPTDRSGYRHELVHDRYSDANDFIASALRFRRSRYEDSETKPIPNRVAMARASPGEESRVTSLGGIRTYATAGSERMVVKTKNRKETDVDVLSRTKPIEVLDKSIREVTQTKLMTKWRKLVHPLPKNGA